MKLYHSPGACSLSPHIVLQESGLPFTLVRTDLKTRRTVDGTDFTTINPKGSVPVLELDTGERLTEGPAIVQYIADQAPGKNLAPANGTLPRYQLQEWLNFITSELHKSYSPLFSPATPAETRQTFKHKLADRYAWVDQQLAGRDYLMGQDFSVADAYLFVVSRWAVPMEIDFSERPNLLKFMARMRARPGVQAALKAEGLEQK